VALEVARLDVKEGSPRDYRQAVLALSGVTLVFAAQYAWVEPTNFGGFDEWLLLWLNQHGILSFPHANRPLQQIWMTPALLVSSCDFRWYYVLHGAYLLASAWICFRLGRKLFGESLPAYLAATFTAVWAPLDMMRLATVQACVYSAVLAASLGAIVLFLEAVERESWSLLAMATALGVVAARSYEGVLALLLGAPLLLPFATRPSRWRSRASLVWEAALGLTLAFVAWPFLAHRPEAVYQARVLEADWNPARYLARLALQFRLSLGPLFSVRGGRPTHPAVWWSVTAFAAFAYVLFETGRQTAVPATRGRLARIGALGVLLAGLAYALIILSPQAVYATRTQILSAPGIAFMLAAAIGLLASLFRGNGRIAVVVALGGWVVGVGATHTLNMQRAWDERSLYAAQVASLRQLVAQAPRIEPGTLLLLIDESGTWPMSFSFRHALALVYPDRVTGHVLGADQIFYALVARPDGFESVPWPVLRGPWRTESMLFPYDRVVVFRLPASRALVRLDAWTDPRLPKLPPGARYEPVGRIGAGSASACTRQLLGEPAS
jgi:hypothetical protein